LEFRLARRILKRYHPTLMRKKKKRAVRRRKAPAGRSPFRDLITANSHHALEDESYGIIQRCVDETLRDPELREKIEYHARQILKAIAAKL
jgi:hypothetical protein